MVIFDCNGVLVDSEPIASVVLAAAFSRVGVTLTPETVAREFHGRRTADIFVAVEKTTKRSLPPNFAAGCGGDTAAFPRRAAPIPHAAHALTWIRGPKAVASSSAPDRIRTSLEVTGLMRFFESRLFSATHVADGKPAPDLFLAAAIQLEVAPADCIVVEDSVPGIAAAKAAGMTAVGFIGSPHAGGRMGPELMAAGARTVIADMRTLASTIIELRGW